jgi:Tfp pilus assembly protein PilP
MEHANKINSRSIVIIIAKAAIITGFICGVVAVNSSDAQAVSGQATISQNAGDTQKEQLTLKIERIEYTAEKRRDPFVSIISLARKKMEVQKKTGNPLENYDVADFKLLGVIFDGKKYYASVVLPDQRAYTLVKGMGVGVRGGKIVDITSDKLVVREYIIDFMGKTEPKYTEIKLRTEEVQ